jgi:hypothetical protein
MLDPVDMVLTLARAQVLALERHERTEARLLEIARDTAAMLTASAGTVPVHEVAIRLQAEFDVWVPQAVVVSDPSDHEPWLEARRHQITFAYWNRYRILLERSLKPGAVEALDETTDQILGLMEDPQRAGPWKNYGMIYGQVQSGKTANYTGVICKAIDAGYRVIVVLTSQHESLRHQTQERLDREFLGFNTKFTRSSDVHSSKIIGVGALGLKSPDVICQAVTTRDTDFTADQLQGTPVNINEVRILVVAKKNARILNNLKQWLDQSDKSAGIIRGLPMLLIDDEADYASVDTKRPAKGGVHSDPDHDPTAINKAIRDLLELFEQRAYLAYTATPFANIFIPNTTDHPEHGQDLFPHSFMIALEPPSNYCGPEMVFGLEDAASGDPREPLPIITEVTDQDTWIPDGHRKGYQPTGPLPATLVTAVDAFILSTAVRQVRHRDYGIAGGHSTMLMHVTRFVDVQGEVARQIVDHLRTMADTWGDYGKPGTDLRARLRRLWTEDFEPTYASLAGRDDVGDLVGPRVSWADVEQLIPDVIRDAAAGVKRINGSAADVLDYQSPTPATVVAVGGDKLSRGLTLEGLSVSYYLRASKNYDTLLQMGRWFGYRPGYLDVTRLYTTPELIGFYVHITRANRELMELTTAVAAAGDTPRDVGMKILDGNENLRVTAAAKMRSSALLSISLAGQRAETLVMLKDKRAAARNYARLEQLIGRIVAYPEVPAGLLGEAGRGLFRHQIPADTVLDFLQGFEVSPRVLTANPENVSDYIRTQNALGELTSWTVAVAGGSSPARLQIHGTGFPLVKRVVITGHSRIQTTECEVGVLTSPSHETLGLPEPKVTAAFQRTAKDFRVRGKDTAPKRASSENLRKERDASEGLLLVYPIDPAASRITTEAPEIPIVGYTLIFPPSEKAKPIRYRVNEVYLRELSRAVENLDDEEGGEA